MLVRIFRVAFARTLLHLGPGVGELRTFNTFQNIALFTAVALRTDFAAHKPSAFHNLYKMFVAQELKQLNGGFAAEISIRTTSANDKASIRLCA